MKSYEVSANSLEEYIKEEKIKCFEYLSYCVRILNADDVRRKGYKSIGELMQATINKTNRRIAKLEQQIKNINF